MPKSSTTTWTCSLCGKQTATKVSDSPIDWQRIEVFSPHAQQLGSPRHLIYYWDTCRTCSERTRPALADLGTVFEKDISKPLTIDTVTPDHYKALEANPVLTSRTRASVPADIVRLGYVPNIDIVALATLDQETYDLWFEAWARSRGRYDLT